MHSQYPVGTNTYYTYTSCTKLQGSLVVNLKSDLHIRDYIDLYTWLTHIRSINVSFS